MCVFVVCAYLERSKDEVCSGSYPLTEVFWQLCTVIYSIMSYSLSEVASSHLKEKTADGTLSQGGRAAPDAGRQ